MVASARWQASPIARLADHNMAQRGVSRLCRLSMAGAAFAQGMTQLLDLASASRTALMCAEAVWWRCHRSLIADALRVRGIEVVHVLDVRHSTPHPMTQPARIVDGRLSYAPPEQETLL